MDVIRVLFRSCSPSRLSFVNVAFDFNASPNDVTPVTFKLLPVDLMIMERNGLLMDAICVMFLLSLQLRLSFVSVVFDFNASIIEDTPASPILLPVGFMRMEELIVDGCHLCCFFCVHRSD